MKQLLHYLKPQSLVLGVAFLLLFVQAFCELALPDYMSKIINQGILMGNTDYIIQTGGRMILVAFGSVLAAVLVGLIASKTAAYTAKHLRKALFEKACSFSNSEFDQFSTASLMTRTTNDITQIQTVMVMVIRMLFYAPILGVGGIIQALSKDVSMSWIIALAVIILLSMIGILMYLALPKFKQIQKLIDRLNLVVRENLMGTLVIRAFHTEAFEEERFDKTNQSLMSVQRFANRLLTFMMPGMMLLMNLTSILIVWIGARQIERGALAIGDMMAFMQYAIQIIMSFLMISMMFILVPRAAVSLKRVQEILVTQNQIVSPSEPVTLKNPKGVITFKNVTFSYKGAEKPALKGIDFEAKPGETTAFIGSTGSGKSTLIQLIPRFYDVTEGEILLDGVNINQLRPSELRDLIGLVPQKAVLFSGTIASNLRFGDAVASDEALMAVSQIAQASEFIEAKPEKLKTAIAQGGSNVSGGQKQRLAIARALAKKGPIYIFDDSFSALDFKTDKKLREALKKYTTHSTVLIVAQRISTIMHADQIIVLDEGRMVGKGTHEMLMKECKVYQEIALSQLSKEELNQ